MSLFLGLEVKSQTYVPDDAFEQALIDLGHDTGPLDDYVPTENINTIISLNVINKGIQDITGIQDFIGLLSLSCGNNNISSLDLTNNTVLSRLFCNNNSLTSLNIKNGNNTNFTFFTALSNSNLTCIQVDNQAYSNTNWLNKDATSSYSENCSLGTKILETASFKTYPNPAKNTLNIELIKDTGLKKVSIYNVLGKLVKITKALKIDISNLSSGLYLLEVETNQGKSVKKIVIE